MQFKTDENLPINVAESLRDAGFDAMTIHDQKMVGNPDPQVAAVYQADKRTLLTLDLKFSDIRTYPPEVIPASSSCVHAITRSRLCCV